MALIEVLGAERGILGGEKRILKSLCFYVTRRTKGKGKTKVQFYNREEGRSYKRGRLFKREGTPHRPLARVNMRGIGIVIRGE